MSDELDRVLAALESHGCKPRRSGEGYAARCPTHEDHDPSLTVADGREGVVLNCHSPHGCTPEGIVARIGLKMTDLFPPRHGSPSDSGASARQVAEYVYTDETGAKLYRKVRMEPKRFFQGAWTGSGWAKTMGDVRRVLYNLPALIDAVEYGDPIYLCEGEKDADALTGIGAVATTAPDGAGKWRPEYTAQLAGAAMLHVVADNDAPGLEHARMVAASLNGTPHRVVFAAAGKDAFDHVAAGYGLEDFVEAGQDPTEPPPKLPDSGVELPPTRVEMREARAYRTAAVYWMEGWEGFVPLGMVTLLAGLPGLGKSMLACLMAAKQSELGRYVCIAAAEDSIEHTLLPRLIAAHADLDYIRFVVLIEKNLESGLRLPDHLDFLHESLEKMQSDRTPPALLIVDPIGSYMGAGINAWKGTEVRLALDPLKVLAELHNMAVVLVAHLNKGTATDFYTRVSDSGAFGQVVRSGLLFARDPDDAESEMRVLASAKLNVGAPPSSRSYRLEGRFVPDDTGSGEMSTATLIPAGASAHGPEALLAPSTRAEKPSPALEEAEIMLRTCLEHGPRPYKELEREAREWGVTKATLQRASYKLGVLKDHNPGLQAGTTWRMPV